MPETVVDFANAILALASIVAGVAITLTIQHFTRRK